MSAAATTHELGDKREAILDAALDLFSVRGFHGTAVPAVAERAKVGAGTIYRYFPSKEALVNALFQREKRALADALFVDFPVTEPPRAQFRAFWQRASGFAMANPKTLAFLELHHHKDYLDDASRAIEDAILGPAEAFFVAGQAAQVIKPLPPVVLGAVIWGAFSGLVRASWEGRLVMNQESLRQAEEICWEAIRA